MAKLNGRLKLADLKESFSVDALSDEFFDEYHIHYDRIVAELARQWKTGSIHHDYVKKMMGRIVFLHFLQKKGWLNGNPTFLRDLFLSSPHQANFLEQVLEPLFFGIFNTESEQRKELFANEHWDKDLLKQWEHLPYLNGGLFERDEVDKMNIRLPASLFNNLFTFLASYNFTVDENDPDDAEIGVDPEMLGKIFESLLEDNKAKGAFYTPKEIVRYMCKESLIAYLTQQLADCRDARSCVSTDPAIRTFVETHEFPSELEPYCDILDHALREVKICDPAIGSGAFPMGLLNELWRCREALSISPVVETCHGASLPMGASSSIQSRAALKREIIENNIYGVDIERGAIDIARLRFWLSIMVDSDEPEALPNFVYKFMQGNSLIESFEGVDLSRMMDQKGMISRLGKGKNKAGVNQYGMEFVSDDTKRNLQLRLRGYFNITDHVKKAQQRCSINDSVKSYIRQQDLRPEAEARLTALDPSANQEFFLWHTWFKDIFDRGGFDIVIGNPPYVQMKKGYVDGNKFPYSEGKDKGKQNLYKLFVEHSYNILANNGICTLITQSSLMCDSSSQYTRELLLKKTTLSQIIEFPKVAPHPEGQLFKGALVATCILLFTKAEPRKNHVYRLSAHNDLTTLEHFDFAVMNQETPIKFYPEGYCFPLIRLQDFSIIEKMNNGTTFLGEMIKSSSQGDFNLTNERYCFSTKQTDVKMYRGCHVHRYYIDNVVEEYIQGNYKGNVVQENINNTYLVCQQISGMSDKRRFNVAITKRDKCLFGNSVNKIALKNSIDPKYILAIINSRIIDWYFRKTSTNNHVNIYELEQLPIPKVTPKVEKSIINLISAIIAKKQYDPSANISDLECEIDMLVYELYGLTEEEVEVVEGKDV